MDKLKKITEKLLEQPELIERIENILDISSNEGGLYRTADEAEFNTRDELNKLGREVLEKWTGKRALEHEDKIKKETRINKTRKKNSSG